MQERGLRTRDGCSRGREADSAAAITQAEAVAEAERKYFEMINQVRVWNVLCWFNRPHPLTSKLSLRYNRKKMQGTTAKRLKM